MPARSNDALTNAVRPQVYLAYSQLDDSSLKLGLGRSMVVEIKAASDPAALSSAVRAAVTRPDPQLPVSDLQTARVRVEASISPQWSQRGLVASFAGLALPLAGIGIYGVISVTVAQRARETGLRMALGASRARILALVIGQGMRLVLAGVALGIAGSFALSRLISRFLFGIPPTDWLAFSVAPLVLSVVAIAANFSPARRAAGMDAVVALRSE